MPIKIRKYVFYYLGDITESVTSKLWIISQPLKPDPKKLWKKDFQTLTAAPKKLRETLQNFDYPKRKHPVV